MNRARDPQENIEMEQLQAKKMKLIAVFPEVLESQNGQPDALLVGCVTPAKTRSSISK